MDEDDDTVVLDRESSWSAPQAATQDVPGPSSPRAAEAVAEPLPPPRWDDEPDPRTVDLSTAGATGPAPPRGGERRPWLPPALARGRVDMTRRAAVALVVVALLAAAVAGALVLRGRPQEVTAPDVLATGVPLPGVSQAAAPSPPQGTPAPGVAEGDVVVAVAGKVHRPGLVRLPAGSRVDDALRAAGGPLTAGDLGLLNLARRLVDGEQVLVGVEPPPGQPPPAGGAAAPGGAVPGGAAAGGAAPVDLNLATLADLDALPGIGPVLAQRIVDWRTEHGRFASVDQLREITGIGESRFQDLRERVSV